MINLLPEEAKRDIRAARTNVILLKYNVAMLIAVVTVVLLCGLFYAILHASQDSAKATSNDSSSKAATYADVRKQADDYRNNLTIANKILGSGVSYTDEIFSITKLVPAGVLLDGITLSSSDAGKQVTFSAHAKSYDAASAMKASFQGSSTFSNVFFQNLTDAGSNVAPEYANYPIQLTLSAKMNGSTK